MGRTITLTTGNDTFRQSAVASNTALTVLSLAGNDTIILDRDDDLGGSNFVKTDLGNDVIHNFKEFGNLINLGDGADTYIGRGFASFSSEPGDQVFGGAGNDTFAVETFKSEYYGGLNNDLFHSVGWQNHFDGGFGIDTISYLPRSGSSSTGTTGVLINLAEGFVETGAIRRETLHLIENAVGSTNDDTIIGTSGSNRLSGAQGFDDLIGGAGPDVFAFNAVSHALVNATRADIVEDFHRVEGDKIDLRSMDADTRTLGNQAFHFVANFTNHAAEVRFDGQFATGDVNGDGVADFRVLMVGVTSMLATDFLL